MKDPTTKKPIPKKAAKTAVESVPKPRPRIRLREGMLIKEVAEKMKIRLKDLLDRLGAILR